MLLPLRSARVIFLLRFSYSVTATPFVYRRLRSHFAFPLILRAVRYLLPFAAFRTAFAPSPAFLPPIHTRDSHCENAR